MYHYTDGGLRNVWLLYSAQAEGNEPIAKVVELTGVVGITAMATTAAANFIHFAKLL